MKSIITTFGTIAASVVASTALAQNPQSPASRPATSQDQSQSQSHFGTQAGQNQFQGKIVSLHEYLAGGSSSSHSSASSALSDPSATTRPGATSRPGEDRAQSTLRDSAQDQSRDSLTDRSSATRTPGATSPGGAFSSSMGGAGPLALVVKDQTSSTPQSAVSSTDSANRLGVNTDRSSGAASASGEKVYVLVFDPQDVASRAAYTRAQSMIASGASSGGWSSSSSDAASDRLQVRDTERDADRQQTPATSPTTRPNVSGRDDAASRSSAYGASKSEGQQVKVTGKILNKGGIQAIQVASIESSAGSSIPGSTTTPGSLSNPSRTPGQTDRTQGQDQDRNQNQQTPNRTQNQDRDE